MGKENAVFFPNPREGPDLFRFDTDSFTFNPSIFFFFLIPGKEEFRRPSTMIYIPYSQVSRSERSR